MSQLLVPGNFVASEGQGPFGRAFFVDQFQEGQAPACSLIGEGEVPVVVLELMNGVTCDIYAFEAFKRDYLVAQVFVDPPECDEFYLSFIRYETIFRVNVRYYRSPDRRLGFKPSKAAVEVDDPATDRAAQN